MVAEEREESSGLDQVCDDKEITEDANNSVVSGNSISGGKDVLCFNSLSSCEHLRAKVLHDNSKWNVWVCVGSGIRGTAVGGVGRLIVDGHVDHHL
ncbi:hypothetical protein NDU88_001640 [Pleurodeles waltl]|uniref:Uncharacterized protein n=1 Tax=Pleurodeles waltl TaxID=8319 RepID=A0AAV7NE04_PLEWA|nr:hypothetical protein NDU88_001640 [Pleurodeles waltl]